MLLVCENSFKNKTNIIVSIIYSKNSTRNKKFDYIENYLQGLQVKNWPLGRPTYFEAKLVPSGVV